MAWFKPLKNTYEIGAQEVSSNFINIIRLLCT